MTIYSSNTHVQAALALARLNVNHPAKIQKALDLLEVTFNTEPLQPPAHPELTSADHVRDAIRSLAEFKAKEAHLEAARQQVRYQLEQDVAAEIQDHADQYIEEIRPGFELAAVEYIKNISVLPAGVFDAEQVAGFNEDQAVAYSRVKTAASTLAAAMQVCREVNHVTRGFNPDVYSKLFYIVDPQTGEGYQAVQKAFGKYDRESQAFKAILPELRDAIQAGAALHLTNPAETTEQVLAAEDAYHDAKERKITGVDVKKANDQARANEYNYWSRVAREQEKNQG